jgi:hypothetical protein
MKIRDLKYYSKNPPDGVERIIAVGFADEIDLVHIIYNDRKELLLNPNDALKLLHELDKQYIRDEKLKEILKKEDMKIYYKDYYEKNKEKIKEKKKEYSRNYYKKIKDEKRKIKEKKKEYKIKENEKHEIAKEEFIDDIKRKGCYIGLLDAYKLIHFYTEEFGIFKSKLSVEDELIVMWDKLKK